MFEYSNACLLESSGFWQSGALSLSLPFDLFPILNGWLSTTPGLVPHVAFIIDPWLGSHSCQRHSVQCGEPVSLLGWRLALSCVFLK